MYSNVFDTRQSNINQKIEYFNSNYNSNYNNNSNNMEENQINEEEDYLSPLKVNLTQTEKVTAPTYKVILVGSSYSGKSKIISAITGMNINSKTVGTSTYIKKMPFGNKHIKLEIWDSSGDKNYRTLVNSLYKHANAVLLVFESSSNSSLYEIQNWEKEISMFLPESCLRYIVKNKIDLLLPAHLNGGVSFSRNNSNFIFNNSNNNNVYDSKHNSINNNNTNNNNNNNYIINNPNNLYISFGSFTTKNKVTSLTNSNKSDSELLIKEEAILNDEELKYFELNYKRNFSVSAEMNYGVEEMFRTIAYDLKRNVSENNEINKRRVERESVKISQKDFMNNVNKKNCAS